MFTMITDNPWKLLETTNASRPQAFEVVRLSCKFGGHFGILFLCFSSKQNVFTTKLRAKGHEENCEKMIES